jgi:hypothetical protein
MAGPIRLDDNIISFATASASIEKRSVPKQIEYWAEIGRRLEAIVDRNGILALMQGNAEVEVRPIKSEPVDIDAVFAKLDTDRGNGNLSAAVTQASHIYEASEAHPGYLDRIGKDGQRLTGYFQNGEFIAGSNRPGTASSAG